MIEGIATALALGMLAEMRHSIHKLSKRLDRHERSHEPAALPPLASGIVVSCVYLAASMLVG